MERQRYAPSARAARTHGAYRALPSMHPTANRRLADSMAITQEVRDYAAALSDNEKKALQLEAERGMEEKSAEFRERGGQMYIVENSLHKSS